MSLLLDSNICIGVLRGRPTTVRARVLESQSNGVRLAISSVVLFELWLGVALSDRDEENAGRLLSFLKGVSTVPFGDEDARVAGTIQADLRRQALEIGPYDLLIAAQALRLGLVLVTADRDFSRVPGLRWENWTK